MLEIRQPGETPDRPLKKAQKNALTFIPLGVHCAVGVRLGIWATELNGPVNLELTSPDSLYAAMADALADTGHGVFRCALAPPLVEALRLQADVAEHWYSAGVGRHSDHQINRFVRRDRVAWIGRNSEPEIQWLDWVEELRWFLNRSLMLGLETFESHFAFYAPGTFYRRHVDAFRGEGNRVVSLVVYLNERWLPGDGGELVLYGADGEMLEKVPPDGGTVAIYLSEQYPHEVLTTRTQRYSIAGWFRQRGVLPLDRI